MDAVFKGILFVGTLLLLGAGVFARWIGPELTSERVRLLLTTGTWLGAALLIVGGFAEIASATRHVLRGSFEFAVFHDYLHSTRHGVATQVRNVLTLLVLAWTIWAPPASRLERTGFAALGLALILSVSWVSHSGALGLLPLLGDGVHLAAAAAWAGSLLYLAWLPVWARTPELGTAVWRISRVGLVAVTVLIASGLYLATLHMYGVGALIETDYGQAFAAKNLLVLAVLAVAAVNRFFLVPQVRRGAAGGALKRAVRAESVLLVAILLATGVLATREPATEHPPPTGHDGLHEPWQTPDRAQVAVPNRIELAAGPISIMPTGAGNLAVHFGGSGAVILDVEAETPASEREPLVVTRADGTTSTLEATAFLPHHEVIASLPAAESGRWRLMGQLDGEAFEIPITVIDRKAPSGTEITVHFVPAPSISGGGLTEMFVTTRRDGEPLEVPVFVRYHLPQLLHDSDDDIFELTSGHAHHDQHLKHATLFFATAGMWEVRAYVGGELLAFEVEVLAE